MPPPPEPERTACLWCADWPVVALRSRDPRLHDVPVAVVERGDRGVVVRAASVEARAEQVVVGLRRREAEARCPGLVIVEADPHVEARTFETVARAVEVFTPRFVLEEPGRLELPTRGPSRYFGGDEAFAERLLASIRDLGIPNARLGIADGRFAALLAARAAEPNAAMVVAPGDSPSFLAPWPVTALEDIVFWSPSQAPAPAPSVAVAGSGSSSGGRPSRRLRAGAVGGAAAPAELADLLGLLGLRTLGAFAALPPTAVLGRFGPSGARAHRLAAGLDERAAPPQPPPPDLVEHVELNPPVAQIETAAFAAKAIAERLLARLEALGLVCTRVMIEAQTEHGERLARCWRHEGALTADALAARVRWQLEGWLTAKSEEIEVTDFATGGLILLRLVPDEVLPATGRQLGFWGGDAAATERAARTLARVQGMLGHPAVVTAVAQGGRTPAERVRWVPWGDPREPVRPLAAVPSPGANALEVPPWPGAIPAPSPARVFDPPLPAELLDASDRTVTVSSRGDPSAAPARLRCRGLPGGGGAVTAWAGPWAHDVRWWDARARSRRAHWQLLVATPDGDSVACLVSVATGHATVEAIYD
jgi:protein ImuB